MKKYKRPTLYNSNINFIKNEENGILPILAVVGAAAVGVATGMTGEKFVPKMSNFLDQV